MTLILILNPISIVGKSGNMDTTSLPDVDFNHDRSRINTVYGAAECFRYHASKRRRKKVGSAMKKVKEVRSSGKPYGDAVHGHENQ